MRIPPSLLHGLPSPRSCRRGHTSDRYATAWQVQVLEPLLEVRTHWWPTQQ